jgi:DNA-binding Lrp family transcriptional regulator
LSGRRPAVEPNDALQARILQELTNQFNLRFDEKRSYAKIAARLGVDEESVRLRVKRATQTGLIAGWELILNPVLIGRRSASVVLEIDDVRRKRVIIAQVKLIEGVNFIFDYDESSIRVALYYRNPGELSRMIELLGLLSGGKNPVHWDEHTPACTLNLKKTDWQIVSALRRNPKRSAGDIAREVGVSTRTVRRRLTFMIEGRAFNLLPLGDLKKLSALAYQFLVHLDVSKKGTVDGAVRRELKSIVFTNVWSGPYSSYAVFCRNVAEAEKIRDWMLGLEGVTDVEMHLMKEIIHVHEWLDAEIERYV